MRRLVNAPLATFEELFERARRRPEQWRGAAYPPACDPPSGPAVFGVAAGGGMVVHVARRAIRSGDFRLDVLFSTGTCVFPTAHDLFAFCSGPLAEAFGLEATESGRRSATAAPRRPAGVTPERLAEELARRIHGQDAALERVAHVVCAQLAKRRPTHPGTLMLLGPTGTGKTSTLEALPGALAAIGRPGAHLFRVDCGELGDSIQLTRLLGAPPGYTGHATETPLTEALGKPGCILLLDEVDRADREVVTEALVGLLDTGRLATPAGARVDGAHAVIAMTSNLGARDLDSRLHRVPLENRWAVQEACRTMLHEHGLAPELVGRVGAFAVYRPLARASLLAAAATAVDDVVAEYGLRVTDLPPVVAEVVLDVAGTTDLGVRALRYAVSELLARPLAEAVRAGIEGDVVLDTGPPIAVRAALAATAR